MFVSRARSEQESRNQNVSSVKDIELLLLQLQQQQECVDALLLALFVKQLNDLEIIGVKH